MNMDASFYAPGCAAQIILLAAQANFGKTLMEKGPLKYDSVARTNLMAAQGDFRKSLMEKDPLKYDGGARSNLLADQLDFLPELIAVDPRMNMQARRADLHLSRD